MIDAVARPWLSLHCAGLPGINRGALFLRGDGGSAPEQIATWPAQGPAAAVLAKLASEAITRREEVVRSRGPRANQPGLHTWVAVPFSVGSRNGAVAVEVIHAKTWDAEPSCKSVVDHLITGLGWLESMGRSESTQRDEARRVALVSGVLEREDPDEAATWAATELATWLSCERAAIGWLERDSIRVTTISHTPQIDAKSELVTDFKRLMEEATDQDAVLVYPVLPEHAQYVVQAHSDLASRRSTAGLCTVPLVRGARIVGALSLERTRGLPFTQEEVSFCEDTARALGSSLAVQRQAGLGPGARAADLMRTAWHGFRSPESEAKRLLLGLAVLLLAFLSLATGVNRVAADATLEGRVQRAIVAGFDGYLAEAHVSAGDVVEEGQMLARLDDRDLALEKRRWEGRRAELASEFREAFAAHDRNHMSVIKAQLDQASAQAALADEKLARSVLHAPFDGVVVRGDLSQALGSPVRQGDMLFQIAPLDGYRIILAVDERDIAGIRPDQPGQLVLSALPDRTFDLRVERVIPVSVAKDGRNAFRVEARLEEPVRGLRPGMEGVGKIDVDRQSLLWIWTSDVVRWVQMKVWAFWS